MTDESLFLDIDMLDNQFAAELALKDSIIAELDQEIAEFDKRIAERNKKIAELDKRIAERDQKIAEKDAEIAALKEALKNNRLVNLPALCYDKPI